MKTATITEVKNGLSALIDQVRAGESILITDRGVTVARLQPVTSAPDPVGRLRRLERAGILLIGGHEPPIDLLRTRGPALRPGVSGALMVIEDRASR